MKPTNSSELIQLNRTSTSRTGAPINIPNAVIQEVSVDTLSLLEKSPNKTLIPASKINNSNSISPILYSSFDSTPNAISPPVPPRQNNLKKRLNLNLSAVASSPSTTSSSPTIVPNHNNNNINNVICNNVLAVDSNMQKNNCLANDFSVLVKSSPGEVILYFHYIIMIVLCSFLFSLVHVY